MVDDLQRDFSGPKQVYGKLILEHWMYGDI